MSKFELSVEKFEEIRWNLLLIVAGLYVIKKSLELLPSSPAVVKIRQLADTIFHYLKITLLFLCGFITDSGLAILISMYFVVKEILTYIDELAKGLKRIHAAEHEREINSHREAAQRVWLQTFGVECGA